ncbi:deoxythymidylate kinase-like protein [Hyaloraphidium curvatum]|nr:deoxythymidylate kinase-like protein [Hyaloraphidium curvatum]
MPRGIFIVLEGADRSGKSTQCRALLDRLNVSGRKAELRRFPDRTTRIGQMINDYLKSEANLDARAVHLLFSANRWEHSDDIERVLRSGVHVIADRYAYSGVAYSVAKGLELPWCKAPDSGLVRPDVVFYLSISGDAAAQREGFGGERYETKEMQEGVASVFQDLKDETWQVVDAGQSMAQVTEAMWSKVLKVAEDSAEEPLKKLWM